MTRAVGVEADLTFDSSLVRSEILESLSLASPPGGQTSGEKELRLRRSFYAAKYASRDSVVKL